LEGADNDDLDDALYVNQVLRFRAERRPNRSQYQVELLFSFNNSMVSTASDQQLSENFAPPAHEFNPQRA
jgi:hypothetical protein